MPKTIWKFVLEVTDEQEINMPVCAKVIHVGVQGGLDLCIWAIVDPTADLAPRRFLIFGTGNPMPVRPGNYLGTAHVGQFVWHVFE